MGRHEGEWEGWEDSLTLALEDLRDRYGSVQSTALAVPILVDGPPPIGKIEGSTNLFMDG